MALGSLANQFDNRLALDFRGSSVLNQSYPVGGYAATVAFSPLSLFAAGEQGVWYDPSDLTTMFEDSAGTTPVHAPGNGTADSPVGKILDKSGRGNHATQSTSTARPTLSARYNLLTATDTLSTQSVTTVATTYTLTFSGGGTITLSGTKTGVYTSGTSTLTGVTAGTLTLTVVGTVTNADLRVSNDGVGLPTYQSVTNANTYDTTGFPYYLKFDGVDDSLSTPSAFTMTTAANLSEYIVYTPTTSSPSVYTRIFEKGSNTSFGLHNVTSDVEWFFPSAIKVPYNPAVTFTGSLYTRLLLSLRVNPGSNPSVSGVAKGSGFNSTASGTLAISAGTSTDSFYISQYGGGGYYGKQNIYQIVVCGNKISDSQDASMLSYLNSRFFVY